MELLLPLPEQPRLVSTSVALPSDRTLTPAFSLHQVMNGWLLNVNPYNTHMGKYFNLDVC